MRNFIIFLRLIITTVHFNFIYNKASDISKKYLLNFTYFKIF